MKKRRARSNKNNRIVKEILKKEFIPHFENWLCHIYKWNELSFGGIILIEMLKEFQKTKNPEVLGRAIRFAPQILDHPIIRTQVMFWISQGSKSRPKKGELRNLTQFAKELIPKPSRKTIIDKFHESVHESSLNGYKELYKIYDAIRRAIEKKFDEARNTLGRRKLYQGDRASALKSRFSKHHYKYDRLRIRIKRKGIRGHLIVEKTFNQCCEEWAKSSKPSDITLGLLSSTIDSQCSLLLGTKALKEIIKSRV